MSDLKAHLHRYLQVGRDAVVWKVADLSEYDQRRPMVPTGTNLLGLVKHLSGVEAAYFGLAFDRPYPEGLRWIADWDADPNADLWATAEESPEHLLAVYREMWSAADETIGALPLDAPGVVPWWRPESRNVTLGQILIHVATETHRHAGHADIVRELVDGSVGLRPEAPNIPDESEQWWIAHRARLEEVARRAGRR